MDARPAGGGASAGSAGPGVARCADIRCERRPLCRRLPGGDDLRARSRRQAAGGKAGAADVAGIDQKIAALLGTDAGAIAIKDLAIHPTTQNAYLSVMRGTGADAKPALLRVDGDGQNRGRRARPREVHEGGAVERAVGGRRAQSTRRYGDRHGVRERPLVVAGLSNEEFASKLRSIPYPFATADAGTSVEIFHGNHGRLETRSPVYTFIPYTIGNKQYLIASYTCTPLVRFPLDSLNGSKVVGTTIAELGNGNRPLDMIALQEGRQGIPADVEQRPRRDEDPDGLVRHAPRPSPSRSRPKPPASATRRSRR